MFLVPHTCVKLIALYWCAWLIMHGYAHAQFCSTVELIGSLPCARVVSRSIQSSGCLHGYAIRI